MSHVGLKKNAISFASNVVIGVASTAPAYSLAAALPALVAAAKFGVPAVLIVAFIPMLFVAAAYYHLNRADPDCGTTFAWVTRAMGPYSGWLGGWAIIATDILVMPGLAQVAGEYSLNLVGIAEPTTAMVTVVGVVWIAAMTLICYLGIELSAHSQKVLLTLEVVILVLFAGVALAKVYSGSVPGAQRVALAWFNPFAVDGGGNFMQACLIAVFVYWGWDTGAAVNEETENPRTAPARAAVVATVILVGLYVLVAVAAGAFAEPGLAAYNGDDFLAPLANTVLGSTLGKLLIFAVLTSAAACTQTTILPTARTVISMARAGALPQKFADIHPRYLTPGLATLAMGAVSTVWYLGLVVFFDGDVLTDSVTATAIGIAFYYGLTGFACAVFHRRELFRSVSNFIFIGVLPVAGGLFMLVLFVGSCINFSSPDQNKTAFHGIGAAFIFGIGALLLGLLLMGLARLTLPDFFRRRPEVVDPARMAANPDLIDTTGKLFQKE
jgi:amino acid transporter